MGEETKKCPTCGTEVDIVASGCFNCGYNFPVEEKVNESMPETEEVKIPVKDENEPMQEGAEPMQVVSEKVGEEIVDEDPLGVGEEKATDLTNSENGSIME